MIVARGELHAKFAWATPTALGRLGLARVLRTRPCSPAPPAPPTPSGSSDALRLLRVVPHLWWGFCAIRSLPSACRRRVVPLLVQFPPFGGGEVAVRGGVVRKVQTTSVKNAENGLLWAKWSAFWANLCRPWCVVRTQAFYSERSPSISHVNPLIGVWAGLPTFALAG